jgi:hypothetical protein
MENDRPPDHVISFRVFASSHLSPGFNKMTYHDILRHYIPWLQNVLFLFLYWTNFPFQPSNEFHALCKVEHSSYCITRTFSGRVQDI